MRITPLLFCGVLATAPLFPAYAGTVLPAQGKFEAAFSPERGATDEVVNLIDSAKSDIRMLAYSFTSKPIARALANAHQRGVDVAIVVDKSQLSEKGSVVPWLVQQGVSIRVDEQHQIMHDKVLIVDGRDVETGSFNYTSAAEHHNAENALIIWDAPSLAMLYLKEWQDHWDHSQVLRP